MPKDSPDLPPLILGHEVDVSQGDDPTQLNVRVRLWLSQPDRDRLLRQLREDGIDCRSSDTE